MASPIMRVSNAEPDLADDLELPSLGPEGEEDVGLESEPDVQLPITPIETDPYDDSPAEHVAFEEAIDVVEETTSAVGDDAEGLGDDAGHGVGITDDAPSFLDEAGSPKEGVEQAGLDELGIDPVPAEKDDGGLEGLDDPAGAQVDDEAFPPLGHEEPEDEEPIDVGLDIDRPPEAETR